MSKPAIEARGLRKALNGSGKTTTVSILATSLRPDAGRATVAGLDVVTEAARVRRVIGLAGQFAAAKGV
jgi:ABC-type multidrug transport system ATPase subunit